MSPLYNKLLLPSLSLSSLSSSLLSCYQLAAKILGVDPTLAKTAINAISTSLASTLLSMNIRTKVVNTMVTTGLSTLKYLNNDYDIRKVLLNNMINNGNSNNHDNYLY